MSTIGAAIKGFCLVPWALYIITRQTIAHLLWAGHLAFGGLWARKAPLQGAQFADRKELKKKGYLDPDGSFYVGALEERVLWKTRRDRVFTHPDQSVVMVAPPGTGKTQTIVANVRVVRLWKRTPRPDMIITDPANGEIHAHTLSALRAMDYNVVVINLHSPEVWSARYDPLTFIKLGRLDADKQVDQLCHLLLPPEADKRNAHFTDVPRLWIAGIIAHKLRMDPDNATLFNCLRLATKDVKTAEELLAAMVKDPNPIVQLGAEAFQSVSKNERGSFISTTARNVKPYLYQDVRIVSEPGRDTEGAIQRGWSFEDMFYDPRPTALFIRAGMDEATSGPYVRLLVGNAINTRRRMLGDGYQFTKGLRVFIDEALSVGNILSVSDANNQLRKALVRCFLLYLSRSHIFEAFPNHIAKGLLDTSAIVYGSGSLDYEGAENISRAIGDTPVPKESRSVGRNGESVSTHEHWERRIRPEEIRQLGEKWAVVMGDVQVILGKPFQWTKKGARY